MISKKSYLIPLLLVITFAVSAVLLATGSEILVKSFFNFSVPLGTFITWIGMIAFNLLLFIVYRKIKHPVSRTTFYRVFMKIFLLFAFIWGFVSFGLAGNWSFTFGPSETFQGSNEAATFFWYYSYAVILSPIILLLIVSIHILFSKIKSNKAKK